MTVSASAPVAIGLQTFLAFDFGLKRTGVATGNRLTRTARYSFDIKLNEIGMIENSGFPDQTYDIWTATGVHAYCGVRSFFIISEDFCFLLTCYFYNTWLCLL